ncbi:hypothetical protein [Halorientalis regularis]|uniref:Uncharacterized protein n=1 Tax=Halorientalis regularis TaxID=660518 RepID=A0A1G7KAT2_9EURY|nr:hypothetical protein [Halorientalis regularis]SDF34285.1 hypothetical protein SAMN05216218_105235 [Halorientalis regularis]
MADSGEPAPEGDDAADGQEERPDHLDDLDDVVGCTGVWERLSERREE